jgi:hypothetical protein
MAENKTKSTEADVDAYIQSLPDPKQRADSISLVTLMQKISGHPPKMWGPSMIGFGQYHYVYESGREGDMFRIGFAPRKGQIVLYIVDGHAKHEALMAKLGKFKTGKSCVYIKSLDVIDKNIFEELCVVSLHHMAEKYPA